MYGKLSVLAVAALSAASPAMAAVVPDGSASFVAMFNPQVDVSVTPATAAFTGATVQISSLGGYASAAGLKGTLNGTINFSSSEGTTLGQSLNNFFVFDDGKGSTFNFSATSALTQSYMSNPGVSQSFSLFLLGTTSNTALGYDPTNTSLTLTFNQTGTSGFSASGTLATPAVVPEPATWAMMVGGFGMIGGALRSRKRTAYTFA